MASAEWIESASRPEPNSELQPCGTYAAWQRHYKAGKAPCEPCAQAKRAYARPYMAAYMRKVRGHRPRRPAAQPGGDVMALSEQVEFAARPERGRGPQEITDLHLTHIGRGLPAEEERERSRAARAIDRLAVQFGMPGAIDELLAYVGVEHTDAMPDPAPGFPLLPQDDPAPAPATQPRRARARWRDGKYCTGCDRVLPLDQFWRDRNRPGGHASRCKTCSRRRRNTTTGKEST